MARCAGPCASSCTSLISCIMPSTAALSVASAEFDEVPGMAAECDLTTSMFSTPIGDKASGAIRGTFIGGDSGLDGSCLSPSGAS